MFFVQFQLVANQGKMWTSEMGTDTIKEFMGLKDWCFTNIIYKDPFVEDRDVCPNATIHMHGQMDLVYHITVSWDFKDPDPLKGD